MMKKYICILAAAAALVSCQNSFEKDWTLATDLEKVTVNGNVEKTPFNVYCSGMWTARITKGGDWLSVDRTSGTGISTIHLIFLPNEGLSRSGELTIESSDRTLVVPVVQKAGMGDLIILFEPEDPAFPAGCYKASISFLTNIPAQNVSEIHPSVRFNEGSEGWISDLAIEDRQEEPEVVGMEGAVRRFVSATVAANGASAVRSAVLKLSMVDAAGDEYADSISIWQTTQEAYITGPARDEVNRDAMSRTLEISSNIPACAGALTTTVEYVTPTEEEWISSIDLTLPNLKYSVLENNSGANRVARLKVAHTDGAGKETSCTVEIEQTLTSQSYLDAVIRTKDELLSWNENYEKWTADDHVKIGADINLDGALWTPRDFGGELDGQGYTISGFKVKADTAGFIKTLTGKIANLTFGATDKTDSIVCTATAGTVKSGIVAISEGSASISNVKSYVNVTFAGTTSGSAMLGGIVGYHNSTGQITGCQFCGTIMMSAALTGTGAHNLGGIAGSLGKSTTISGCTNSGDVISSPVSHAGSPNVGGIIGYLAMDGAEVSGCRNDGIVEYTGAPALPEDLTFSGQVAMGGIVGYHNTYSAKVTSCINTGTVRRSVTKILCPSYLGGIIGYDNHACTITGCSSETGALVTNTTSSSAKNIYMGGIVGYSNTQPSTFISCTNYCDVVNSGTATYIHLGGIVGQSNAADLIGGQNTPCANNGAVTNTAKSSNASSNTVPNISLGGIVGWGKDASVTYCTNRGAVSNSGGLNYSKNLIAAGGITGTFTGAAVLRGCTNNGAVAETGTGNSPNSYVGGILGYTMTAGLAAFKDCENTGEISSSGTKANQYSGGIAGYVTTNTTIEDCNNTADGLIGSNSSIESGGCTHLGGVCGYIKTGVGSLKGCRNAAKVENTGKSVYCYCGGVLGRVEVDGSSIVDCHNTGDLINSGDNITDGGIRLGGIVGQVRYALIDGCTQSGNIMSTHATAPGTSSKLCYAAGIAGLNNSSGCMATIKNCKMLSGTISIAGTGTKKLGALLNTTIATPVSDCGVSGRVTVGTTAITADNYSTSSLLNGHTGKPVFTNIYFITE